MYTWGDDDVTLSTTASVPYHELSRLRIRLHSQNN